MRPLRREIPQFNGVRKTRAFELFDTNRPIFFREIFGTQDDAVTGGDKDYLFPGFKKAIRFLQSTVTFFRICRERSLHISRPGFSKMPFPPGMRRK